MTTHPTRLAVVTAIAALVCAILGGRLAAAQSARSVAAAPFHAPVGFDRASGIRTSLRQKAPADVMVLPAAQVAAVDALTESFDDITLLPGAGWALTNNSAPVGPSSWFQGNATIFPAHEGVPNGYIAANYESAGDAGTISNWLITPEVTIVNGTELRFWTRRTAQSEDFPDRLEVRLSVAGASVDVGASAESVGDFTELLLTINETLEPGGYPAEWTEYVLTVRGRSRTPVTGRFAFRYWVTDTGSHGDYIGLDTVRVSQPGDTQTITHSMSLDSHAHGGGWCFPAGGTANNQYLRTFTLSDFGITGAFKVTALTFGVGGVFYKTTPVTVNLYTLDGDFTYDNLTLLGSATVDLPPQEETLVTVPVTGEAPAGSTLVVEISAPFVSGEMVFSPGVNDLGETAPSYWASDFCGLVDPVSMEDAWGTDIHVVMTVTGEPSDTQTITHSESLDILDGAACMSDSDDGTTAATQFLRTVTLTDFGITGAFDVTAVTFGVEAVRDTTASITVNLYTLEGDFTYANLTPIGSATVDLPPQELTLVTVPVTGEAPAGSTLVVEMAAPDLRGVGGFSVGANDLGETAPSYIASDSCDTPEPTAIADIFPWNLHFVMTVTGETETADAAATSARPSRTSLDLTSGSVPMRYRHRLPALGSRSGLIRSPERSLRRP
ncbi:MAG: choice-of-anchor J domain-containing protein [Vicinamibacteraceae bacterium]